MSYIGNPIVSTDFPVDYKSGNGSTTAFTLSVAPASVNSIDVQVSGVSQSPQTYSVSGTTLTFSAAPPSGTNNIVVRHLGIAGIPNVPTTASVTSASLAAQDLSINGVTVGKGGGNVATNTVVGYQAANSNVTGAEIVAVGYQALYSNTGSQSTAVGVQALRSNTSGSNAAFGQFTLYANTTGTANAGFGGYGGSGNQTLVANTTGSNNSAFGMGALASNTTASNNTAVGYQAGYSNTTGITNTFVGSKAGYSTTTNSYNTYIGEFAGYNTTSAQNTFVGEGCAYLVTSGGKNTVIGRFDGNQGGLDIRTSSNYIVLSDGDGNPRCIVDNLGNLTVGTATANNNNSSSFGFNIANGNQYNNHVSGTGSGNGYIQFALAGTVIGTITQNGTTAVAYNTTSDYRLKENVAPMTGALARVQALKPVTYTWKAAPDEIGEGFIAHELAEVCPQAVTGEKDDVNEDGSIKPQAIDTSFLVATLTSAIQELNAKVEAQALEIQALKGTV